MTTLGDGGVLAGWLAAIAAVVTFGYSRTDHAAEKRKEDAKAAAREVLEEENVAVRLNSVEVILPRVEADVKETKELVKSTNATLNQLAVSVARIPVRREQDAD